MNAKALKILEIGARFIVTEDHRVWDVRRHKKDFTINTINHHVCLVLRPGSHAIR